MGGSKQTSIPQVEMIFCIEEGHEDEYYPDNISINMGTNRYSAEEHTMFREAIV